MSNLTTPAVRVSYPSVFTPRAINPGDTPKYGIVIMLDKTDDEHKTFIKKLHAEAKAAQTAKWPDPAKAPRIPLVGHDLSPIKDGDKAMNKQGIPLAEKNPEYVGHWIVRANTVDAPIVVDRSKAEILDKRKVYGGCYCKVNLNPYAYDTKGNMGITFGLNGVQFWSEGESLGGSRPVVDDMFESEGADDPANYGDGGEDLFGAGADEDIPF